MNYSNNITLVHGVMTRYIGASVLKSRESIYDDISVADYDRAD